MSTKIDICNRALSLLGITAVSTLDIDSTLDQSSKKSIRECNLHFDIVRDTVLYNHSWVCAKARATLVQDTATPAFGYSYQYHLPADELRVLYLQNCDDEWVKEGRKLLTGGSSAKIVYTRRIVNFGELDPLSENAIAYSLAIAMAQSLVGKTARALKADLSRMLDEDIMMQARRLGALQTHEHDRYRRHKREWVQAHTSRPFSDLTLTRPV